MNRTNSAPPAFAGAAAVIVLFAALARGAHDLWSAAIVHAALLGLTAAMLVRVYLRSSDTAVRLPLAVPAALVLGAGLLSAAFAANRFDAIFALKDLAAALLAFFIGANALGADENNDVLLMIVVPVQWIQVTTMVMQIVSTGLGGRALTSVDAVGTLVNPNIQAAFALFWVPPLAMRTISARETGVRFSYFASGLAAALLTILLAGSTWALVCLGVAVLGAVALRAQRPARVASLVLIGVAAVAAVVWVKVTATDPTWTASGVPAPAGSDRLRWWTAAVRMFADHPWAGIGAGGFPTAYPAYKYGSGQSTLFAHSLPLTVMAEAGMAGLVAAAAFLVAWWRRADRRSAFAVGAMLFLASCLVNVGAEYLVNQITLGLFLGIAVAAAPAACWRPRLSVVVLVSALAVLTLPLLAAPFLAGRFIVDGTTLLADRDFSGAEKRFASAVELDGTSWEAHYGLSMSKWTNPTSDRATREGALRDIERAFQRNRLSVRLRREVEMMRKELSEPDVVNDAGGRG